MALLPLRSRSTLAATPLAATPLAATLVALLALACGGGGDGGTETLTPAAVAATVATSQSDTVGEAAAVTPAVKVTSSNGRPVPGVTVTFAATGPSGSSVANTSSITDANGVASAGSWTLGTATGAYTVTATVAAIPSGNSVIFTATGLPDAPTKLVFLTQPTAAGEVNAALGSVRAQLQDQHGNIVSQSGVSVTLALGANPGSATLGGTLTQTTVDGVATFSDLLLNRIGSGYTLVASAAGLASATSSTFAIALTPSTVTATTATLQTDTVGKPVAATPAVRVTSPGGQPVPGVTVTFAVGGTAGGSVANTSSITDANGIATPGSWTLGTAVGTYTLTAVAIAIPTNNSVVFTANGVADAPAKLVFTVQPPTSASLNATLGAVQVQVQDQHGNLITTAAVPVTLALGANPGGATLGGTLTRTTVNGVATFADLSLNALGTGYTLVATSPGLQSATSVAFTVAAARIFGTVTRTADASLLGAPRRGVAAAGSVGAARAAATAPRISVDQAGRRRVRRPSALGARAVGVPPQPRYAPGELIVKFRESTPGVASSASAMSNSAARGAARVMRERLDALSGDQSFATRGVSPVIRAARIVVDPSRLDEVADRLRQDPAIESVSRSTLARAHGGRVERPASATRRRLAPTTTVTSNDTYRVLTSWAFDMMDLPEAWALTTGSSSVMVAVIDNGIRFDHPDIAANLTNDGYDFVSAQTARLCNSQTQVDLAGDGNGYDPDPTAPIAYEDSTNAQGQFACVTRDDNGGVHGLHVAGTIGAVGNNSAGLSGVNWSVRIRPVRALNARGSGSFYDIAQAVLYAAGLPADNGQGGTVVAPLGRAPIISMSLGGPGAPAVLTDAVNRATAAGSLIIASAGNDAVATPEYPAAYDNVISVAAVGPNGRPASYSNFGSTVDIAAPGGDICDEGVPTPSNPCAGVTYGTFGVWSTDWSFAGAGSAQYGVNHGTSMATPQVAGIAALLLAREPGLTAADLRNRLLNFAVDSGAVGRDDLYGFGIVNAYNSLTQTRSSSRPLFAALYDATTGARVATTRVGAGGAYEFPNLASGSYRVYAGEDEGNDLQSDPGRRWTAYAPGSRTGKPATIIVAGDQHNASFSVAFPSEQESNNSAAVPDVLPVGGYVQGSNDGTEQDWFRLQIPAAGTYTIETAGAEGSCGFAMELDTDITLFQSDGATQIARNDDLSTTGLQWCSRLTASLVPGTYYVRVIASPTVTKAVGSITGFLPIRSGRYRIQLRL